MILPASIAEPPPIAMITSGSNSLIGFVGVDNPRTHFDDATLLLSLQYFIVNSQSSQKQQERLQFLSFRDMLTGLYNRNKYMKVLESCEYFPVRDTGVAYIDLNGLKQVNDSLGHEAGDRLICSAALFDPCPEICFLCFRNNDHKFISANTIRIFRKRF